MRLRDCGVITDSDITLVIIASSGGKFQVTCADGGPDDGCSPILAKHDSQGRTGGWHSATGGVVTTQAIS
jgi:hypothetical protein